MGKVTYDGIEPGDARDATVVNAILTAINTQSTAVGAANIEEEGLDEGSLDAGSVTDHSTWLKIDAPGAGTFNNVLANVRLTLGAIGLALVGSGGTGFTIASDEDLVVVAACEFPYQVGVIPGVPAGRRVVMEIWYQLNGGAATYKTHSRRKLGDNAATEGSLKTFAKFDAGTYDWIEIRTYLEGGAGNYRASFASIYGTIYKRMS